RSISTFGLGQCDRLASVRFRVLEPSRQPSRSRIAGGELRFGTVSMYRDSTTTGPAVQEVRGGPRLAPSVHGNIDGRTRAAKYRWVTHLTAKMPSFRRRTSD